MSHEVSANEPRLPEGIEQQVRRGVARLVQLAHQGPDVAAYVVGLLNAVTDEAANRRQPAVLPSAEQAIWEGLGARSGDADTASLVRIRRASAFADLVARSIQGDTALAKLLGRDRSRISQRLAEHSIYAFEIDSGERCFPRWQFQGKKPLRGLRKVLSALDPGLHPLTVDHWFLTPNLDLVIDDEALSPVDWLSTGGDPKVLVDMVPEA